VFDPLLALEPLGASDCELLRGGFLSQPANALSSLAFVVVGIAVAAWSGRCSGPRSRAFVFAGCLILTGLGSVAYHGPQYLGAELVHDLSIVFLLAFIALQDLELVRPRFNRVVPSFVVITACLTGLGVLVPIVAPLSGDVLVVAVLLLETLIVRRRLRPRSTTTQQRALGAIAGALAVGIGLFAIGRTSSPLCEPMSILQAHAGWHMLAAVAFVLWWWLAMGEVATRSQGDAADRADAVQRFSE